MVDFTDKLFIDTRLPRAEYPHKFPPYYHHSKAVRRQKIGDLGPNKLKGTTFFIFVLHEEYGACKLTTVNARHLKGRGGKKGYHFDFRCNFPKERVMVFAVGADNVPEMFDTLHETLIKQYELPSLWQPVAGANIGDLSALCDDSFEEESNGN